MRSEVPSAITGLFGPPDGVPPSPPTQTRAQLLPFAELSWENFERLCHRLAALDGNVEHCARHGRQGDAQAGIDIYARYPDGRYHCLQVKRHSNFGPAKIREAVTLFLTGDWASRADRFTLAVQSSLQSAAVQLEIERQATRLRKQGIALSTLDGEQLTERLRSHPTLVDDFFGRAWVAALLGDDIASSLGPRLDGRLFADIRAQLARIYPVHFHFIDPGSFGSVGEDEGRAALTLLERFVTPDFIVREVVSPADVVDRAPADRQVDGLALANSLSPLADTTRSSPGLTTNRSRRVNAATWTSGGDRLAVVGDAGSGKSTLLRVIALDLLHGQAKFPELAERWGGLIPLYIPFARWAAETARAGGAIGLKEIIRLTLQPLLTACLVDLLDRAIDERRVLLLVDGLDEWSEEQAARATLSMLVTTAEGHTIPAIVSGRPRGLDQIGTLPASWKRSAIAPLSRAQQAEIAARWFERYTDDAPRDDTVSAGRLRTQRFMAELAREPSLATFATVPLLLVGLITLALRGQILPRTRPTIFDQLIRVLLEVHPVSRATSAGDTQSRFRFAQDADQRRNAIARLAFAIRHDGSGAALPLQRARDLLRAHLRDPAGYAMSEQEATAAANEILAVNAETQGLIIEKSPSEVGFVHASFEEFLCAEHIGGWPFPLIEEFARNHAGDSRWRNVLVNLVAGIQRRDELDRLITIIEEPCIDELAAFARTSLLGEIGVGAAARAPATARRLGFATIDRVENGDWMPARRDALATALKALSDPALRPDTDAAIERWLPARATYRASLVTALADWPPTDALRATLWQALHDEDRGVQRAAAGTFAVMFAASDDVRQRLVDGLTRTRSLTAAIAMLESLALGWPAHADARPLFEAAAQSSNVELRLVGLLGLAENGEVDDQAKNIVLASHYFWSDASSPYQGLAGAMLLKYWPNDDALVKGALVRAAGNFDSAWDPGLATSYLLRTPVERTDVRAWILSQLATEFPFNMATHNGAWTQVGRFAAADPDIRAAVNAYWREPKHRLIHLHFLHGYVANAADDTMAALLVDLLPDAKRMDRHWIVLAMLTGWGRDHPLVKACLDQLITGPDDALIDLVALVPRLDPDPASARERLLRLGALEDVRRDLLAAGFAACGCDGRDDAAVTAILRYGHRALGIFDPAATLFRTFAQHPRVRALAIERLDAADPPLTDLAAGYADDPPIANTLQAAAAPLPSELRAQIVEFASAGAAGTVLEDVLARWRLESDAELRTRMVIAHFDKRDGATADDQAWPALLAGSLQVGPEFETQRATAFAGLIMTGGLEALAALKDRDKPIELQTGGYFNRIPSLEQLICERFEVLQQAFGDNLAERFQTFGDKNRLAEILARAPGASAAARRAFLDYADADALPPTPQALRALAAEAPASRLLLDRCLAALDAQEHSNARTAAEAEIGLILRTEFPGNEEVRDRLTERFKKSPSANSVAALAVFDPDAPALPQSFDPEHFGHELADWALGLQIAGRRADATTFGTLVQAMIARRWRSQFDAQAIANIAVEERLARDTDVVALFKGWIETAIDPSISASAARYLAAAGTFDADSRSRVGVLVAELTRVQQLPVAAYDAVAARWRTARAALLDALFAGLETS
ncbi:energy-coupling factor transporter ATP-binding protein EcfA2 [Stakelama sediminis]|uniref:Energy-coupling factor transporter ATP-binding protein EcfA2 n=1 Tax=Stakelama sediminis TaxID=463200 RepID=A0A840Z359_9SPHN|nr:NACHT domain-containing protein [Stakelama sediminis]MBB5720194.1 energy-coupling factor transporter ATP-binding protein EcfA2 [Stakelama sediminis]